jgi:autotransporter-associated beta strand protein
MKLTDSSAAKVGVNAVRTIASATSAFLQFMVYSATTISSVISGAIGLIKNGPGELILSGNNTYSGGTYFYKGLINYNSSTAFGTGDFFQEGGSQIATSGNVNLLNNFKINDGTLRFRTLAANSITVSGNISGAGGLNKTGGGGTLQLNGTLTYTGSTTITVGFIRAIKTTGASTATATFQSGSPIGSTNGLSLVVSFNVAPPSGVTAFRFFQGTTVQTYAAVTLTGLPAGSTAIYNSATSTLSVTVP